MGKFTNFLGKIFGGKKEERWQELHEQKEQSNENEILEEPYKKEILYKDLDAFIKKKQEIDENKVKEKATPLIDKCLECIKNMKNIVEEIKNEEIKGLDKRVERIVQSNKVMFIKIMEKVLNTDIDKDANISEIKVKILKIAQTCGETDIQYGRYVAAAHSQMEGFRKNLKILANNAMDLNKINIERYDEYVILKDKFNKYINKKKRLAEIKNLLTDLERELQNSKKNLKELENSEKFKLMNDAINEKAKILTEKDRIETGIYSKISSIGRILKKIRKQNNIKEISLYIDNPMIFLERDDYEILNFLKLPADLKKTEQDKILSFENNLPFLIEEKKRYKEILEKEKKLNEDIRKFDVKDEIKKIQNNISDTQAKIEEGKKEIERFEKGIQNLQKEISETKEKLEDKLDVKIKMEE